MTGKLDLAAEAGPAGRAGLTRVLAVAPYANPHVTSIYDALAGQEGIALTRAALHALPPERVALGWPEMSPDAPYLQPWRRLADRWALRRALASADIAILPGPFHFKRLPFDFAWRLAFSSGPILAWSEPFLAFRERSAANLRALSAVARLLDSPRIELLSIGKGAIDDYRSIGVTRWRARSFAFAVEPRGERVTRPDGGGEALPLRLLFAGELIERKRVDLLLEALGGESMPREGWELEIVGVGPERGALEALARRLGIAGRVAFRGMVHRPGVLELLGRVDVAILPSRFDGWGAIVNEALEASVACVVSDACGAASLLEHGVSGLVFRSGDARELGACLARLVAEPGLAARLGAAGHEAVLSQRPDAVATRLAALCRARAGHGPAPAFSSGILREIP